MARLRAVRDEPGWQAHPRPGGRLAGGGWMRPPGGPPPAPVARPWRPAAQPPRVAGRLGALLLGLVALGTASFLLPARPEMAPPTAAGRPALLLISEGRVVQEIAPFAVALREAGFAVLPVSAPAASLAAAGRAELAQLGAEVAPVVVALGEEAARVALAAPLGGEAARAAVTPGCPRIAGEGPVLLVTTGPEAACGPEVPPGTAHLALPRPAFAAVLPAGNGAWFTAGRGDAGTRRHAAKEVADWLAALPAGAAAPR